MIESRPVRRFRLSAGVRRHLIAGSCAVVAVLAVFGLLELSTETWGSGRRVKSDGTLWRYNIATGSVALAFVVATLSIGPLRRLRGKRTPVHLPWRRVTGVWAAIVVFAHFPGGLAIHTSGWRLYRPFASVVPGVPSRPFDEFTVGYWAGLLALTALVPLAATSNDASLRRLGPDRWKRLHRLAYLVLGLVAIHIVSMQYGESRDRLHAAGVWLLIAVAVVLRAATALAGRRPSG